MSYRLTDPAPVLLNLLGTARAANGSLTFYEKGTTTPKDTWSDQDLTVLNDNPVPLDSSGRAETEIWLDGEYTVVAKASDDTTIWTRVVAPEIAPGLAIPDLTGKTGWFLSNNGSVLVWQDILALLLPDPSGSAGYQVVVNSDGTGYILQPPPTPEELSINIEILSSTRQVFTDDDGNKMQILQGTATTSGGLGSKNAQGTVTYSNAFSSDLVPMITAVGGPFAPGNGVSGYWADVSCFSHSATGFVANFNTNHGESNADGNISGNITFGFLAIGPID